MSDKIIPKEKIALKNIDMFFSRNKVKTHVLDDISLSVYEGEFVVFIGPSGCGKSTLLRIIAGLLAPTGGEASMDGKALEGPGADRAMVFQDDSVFPWLTVEQNIEYGLKVKKMSKPERGSIVEHYLNLVGLNARDLRGHFPKELSGGMRKRVDMARAFANDPEVLLMDEPFGMLDAMTKEHLQVETLNIWGQTKKTICFVTHDLEEAIFLADRIIFLESEPGKIYNVYEPPFPRPRDVSLKMDPQFQKMRRDLIEVMNLLINKGRAHSVKAK